MFLSGAEKALEGFFLVKGPRGITNHFLCMNITVASTPWLSLVPLLES